MTSSSQHIGRKRAWIIQQKYFSLFKLINSKLSWNEEDLNDNLMIGHTVDLR